MEETKNSPDPPDYRESQSFKRSYAGTFLSQPVQKHEESIHQRQQSDYTEGEPSPMELERMLKWLRDPKNHNPITAGSALGILAITAIYAVFAGIQSCAMLKSNEINLTALQSVQRAFVIANPIQHQRATVPGPNNSIVPIWQFFPTWENAGDTTATKVVTAFYLDHLSSEPDEERFVGNETDYPRFEIGPRAKQSGSMKIVPDSFIQESRTDIRPASSVPENKKIFAWGWLAYRDVLPDTDPHLTEFCRHLAQMLYGRLSSPEAAKALGTDFSPNVAIVAGWEGCKEHNCTDKDCKDYDRIINSIFLAK